MEEFEYVAPKPPEKIDAVATQTDSSNFNPDRNKILPWQVAPPSEVVGSAYKQLNQIDRQGNDLGIQRGKDAASTLFNQNSSGFAKALNARANRAFARNQSSFEIDSQHKNIVRNSRNMARADENLAQIDNMRRVNFANQLRFASELSNYHQQLDAAKMQTLGSIISNVGIAAATIYTGGAAGVALGAGAAAGANAGGRAGSDGTYSNP